MPNQMSQEEILAEIEKEVKRKHGDKDPRAKAAMLRQRGEQQWNLPIEEAKPDPELAAQRQIQQAVNRPAGAGNIPSPDELAGISGNLDQILGSQPAPQPINPETGMPFYSAPAAVSPEDAQRRQEMQMRMEFLKRKSQGL